MFTVLFSRGWIVISGLLNNIYKIYNVKKVFYKNIFLNILSKFDKYLYNASIINKIFIYNWKLNNVIYIYLIIYYSSN